MGNYAHNPYGSGDRAVRSIDRNREKERRVMLKLAQQHAEELALVIRIRFPLGKYQGESDKNSL